MIQILYNICIEHSNQRGLIQCINIITQINYIYGQYNTVISQLLSSRTLLDSVSDAYLLSQHINILVKTYMKQSNYNEARSVASLSLCLLKDVCIIMYDKKSILNKGIP